MACSRSQRWPKPEACFWVGRSLAPKPVAGDCSRSL
jgi:hypothetical protein